MLRRAWKPIAGTIIGVGAPASLYYYYTRVKPATFDLKVRETGPDGKRFMTTRSFDLLSTNQVEKRLKENAIVQSTPRPSGIVWNRATASLASNNPIEDASASAIIERDKTETGPEGDLLFFAVMDGHVRPSRRSLNHSISLKQEVRHRPVLTLHNYSPRPSSRPLQWN
jgi:pyruvate dehydrogenase phosphatase